MCHRLSPSIRSVALPIVEDDGRLSKRRSQSVFGEADGVQAARRKAFSTPSSTTLFEAFSSILERRRVLLWMPKPSPNTLLQEQIDTTTVGGKLIFHLFASLAEFERDLIRERTNAGLSAARARGRKGGRPKGVDQKKQKAALALKKEGAHSVREICAIVGIARNTYYKYTRAENQPMPPKRHANEPKEHRPAPQPK